jgi:hypothetical protein
MVERQTDTRFAEFNKSIKPYNRYSQFSEDSILEAIFNRIGVANHWCVECGAADGLFFSNTRHLIEQGWNSVQIEGDKEKYAALAERYENWGDRGLGRVIIFEKYAADFDGLFSTILDLPTDFDLLVIDVDGQDYYLWNSLLKYRPRVVMCEFDPNADPDFIPEYWKPGQAGERAIHHVALARGYQVICKTQCNLICVRNDLCHFLTDSSNETVNRLESLGAMTPVREAQPSATLFAGYSEEQLIEAKAQRAKDGNFLFAASMSTPRWGPLSTMDVIQTALTPWSVPFFRSEGAYWHHQLTDAIERALKLHPDAIMTFDYDSLFCSLPQENDIARLVTLLIASPDVDVVVPLQMRRESSSLIAMADGDMHIGQPLMPVWFAHFGMTLFRASVFERISKPWFWEKPDPNGSWGEGRIDPDTGFWLNCKENGIKVCMATDVLLGHGEYGPTYPDDEFKPIRMSLNDWRKNGQRPPANAFNRQRFVESALNGTNPIAKVSNNGESR